MAQLVKLEPGDILVLSNVDSDSAERLSEQGDWLKDLLGVDGILVFDGPVDLSKVPADALARP